MAGTGQYTGPLRLTEELVRASFSDEAYAILAGADGARPDALVAFQKQFKVTILLARRQLGTLKRAPATWQEQVQRGKEDFDPSREEWFKGA